MSQLFDGLAALDRRIANRWKIRTHDNVRHIPTAADIDFIFADIIRSARTTDITENQGSAIIMLSTQAWKLTPLGAPRHSIASFIMSIFGKRHSA